MTTSQLRFLLILAIYLLVLFALALRPSSATNVQSLNLVPFHSILHGLQRGGLLLLINVLGNIAVFVPLGILVPGIDRRCIDRRFDVLVKILIIGIIVSLAIEVMQWLGARRVADVDDVLLNALGTLIGYGCRITIRQTYGLGGTRLARRSTRSTQEE